MLSMSGVISESRTHNSMLQLTSLVTYSNGPVINMTYAYSATQNNGKIISQTDNLSGEQVVYAYDALNRLASATAGSTWGQSYNYDGFGNLTDQTVTAGSAPSYHVTPDPSTNHLGAVDSNGNSLYDGYIDCYDVQNRFTGPGGSYGAGSFQYSYAPGNKRVWRGVFGTGNYATDEITFWSVSGQKMTAYNIQVNNGTEYAPPSITFNLSVANYYFGGKLIGHYTSLNGLSTVAADRLGSIGHFYP